MSLSLYTVIAEAREKKSGNDLNAVAGTCILQCTGALGAQVALLQSPIPPAASATLQPWLQKSIRTQKKVIKGPPPTYPPVIKTVYRPNERVKFSDIPMIRIKKRNFRIPKTVPVDKPHTRRLAVTGTRWVFSEARNSVNTHQPLRHSLGRRPGHPRPQG